MGFKFNPLTGKLDLVNNNVTSEDVTIPQYFIDPASPGPEEVWVRATVLYPLIPILSHTILQFGLTTGESVALVPNELQHTILQLGMTGPASLETIDTVAQYELRYRTKQGVTKGVTLT